jgi:hypothetical protein
VATTVLVAASITPFLGHTAQEEGDRARHITSHSRTRDHARNTPDLELVPASCSCSCRPLLQAPTPLPIHTLPVNRGTRATLRVACCSLRHSSPQSKTAAATSPAQLEAAAGASWWCRPTQYRRCPLGAAEAPPWYGRSSAGGCGGRSETSVQSALHSRIQMHEATSGGRAHPDAATAIRS